MQEASHARNRHQKTSARGANNLMTASTTKQIRDRQLVSGRLPKAGAHYFVWHAQHTCICILTAITDKTVTLFCVHTSTQCKLPLPSCWGWASLSFSPSSCRVFCFCASPGRRILTTRPSKHCAAAESAFCVQLSARYAMPCLC